MVWSAFWDSFSHAIDNATNLGKCKKFTYLRDCLTGDAHKAIEGWTISVNYEAAKEYLKNRFGTEEDRKQALWARLMKIPAVMKSSDAEGLRNLLDVAWATTLSLHSLGVKEDSYDSMFKVMLRQKIQPDLDTRWLLSRDVEKAKW